jgi:hypothetical protein
MNTHLKELGQKGKNSNVLTKMEDFGLKLE